MVDFMGMFDTILNVLNVTKAASETSDEDKQSEGNKKSEETIQLTKEETDRIIEQREEQMKQRRADQSQIQDQHRHQHRR